MKKILGMLGVFIFLNTNLLGAVDRELSSQYATEFLAAKGNKKVELSVSDKYCSKGLVDACFRASEITGPKGTATLEDLDKSFSYLIKTCENGSNPWCNKLGKEYWGEGDAKFSADYNIQTDLEEGLKYFKIGCERNHKESCGAILRLYTGKTDKIDPDKTYLDINKAVEFVKDKYSDHSRNADMIFEIYWEAEPRQIEKAKPYALKVCEKHRYSNCTNYIQYFLEENEKEFAKELAEANCNAGDDDSCKTYKKINKELKQ